MTRPTSEPSPFRLLFRALRSEARPLSAGAFSVLLVAGSALAIPYSIKQLLEPLLQTDASWSLGFSGLILALLFILNGSAGYFQATLFHAAAGRITQNLQRALMRQWFHWSPSTLQRHEIGGLLSVIQHDIEAIYQLIASGIAPLVQNGFTLAGGLLVIGWYSWPMAVVLTAIIALPGLAVRARSKRITNAFKRAHHAMEHMSAWLEIGLSHFIDVRVYHAEASILKRCADHLDAAKTHRLRAQTLQSQSAQLLYVVFCLLTLVILFGGGLFMPAEKARLSLLLMLFIYAYTSAQAAIGLYRTLGIVREARPCLERIAPMLPSSLFTPPLTARFQAKTLQNHPTAAPAAEQAASPAETSSYASIDDAPDSPHSFAPSRQPAETSSNTSIGDALPNTSKASPIEKSRCPGSIFINNMTFSYNEASKAILSRLHLFVERGSWVVLTGESGCGKSTLLALIAGLYGPVEGLLLVNGIIPWGGPSALNQANVALANATPGLFPGSLDENIALGRKISRQKIDEALKTAQLSFLDRRYARPEILSAGQQARVGIARALVGDPDILALDEATGPLDAETERAFWTALRRERASKTTLIVTHRPERIPEYDVLYRLEEGRLRS